MYLSLLNESQKNLFLSFAYNLAVADGNYSEEEKILMNSYCNEMQIELNLDKVIKPIEKTMAEINLECDEREKKIIIFEAIGLAMSDNNYDKSEKELICMAMANFNIEGDFDKACNDVLNEYIEFQNKINKLVLG